MSTTDWNRCPRCNAAVIVPGSGTLEGALSRTTRDEGAEILVCNRCGTREAHMEGVGRLAPITEWPLSVDALLDEERVVLTFDQNADITFETITPDDAADLLGED